MLTTLAAAEKAAILAALLHHRGNITAAARALGCSCRGLYGKMKRHRIAAFTTRARGR